MPEPLFAKEDKKKPWLKEYPICVTKPVQREDLKMYLDWFDKQDIPVLIVEMNDGRFVLWRAITDKEKEELKTGEWVLREGSFDKSIAELKKYRGSTHYRKLFSEHPREEDEY